MNEDALDLLREFCARNVRFMIIGAHAVGYYSEPRATGDLDLLTEPTLDNARLVFEALRAFGAPLTDLTVEDLATPGTVYQMGVPPYRIDLMTQITGVDFEQAWRDHATVRLAELTIPIISRAALLENKAATGRAKDRIDLELIKKHRDSKR